MKVHVTGGSGFLGRHVVPMLIGKGYEVTALARSADAAERLAGLGATPIAGDLSDGRSIEAAFLATGAEVLVNLASLGSGYAPDIVAAAEMAGLSRAVFVSTTAIHTRLNTGSTAVRTAAENTVRASSLEWTIIRPTMIYGTPSDRNIARLLRVLRRSPLMLVPGGGQRLQQPVHVDDVAMAVTATLEARHSIGMTYEVAGPEPLTFRQLLEEAANAVERRVRFVPIPLRPTVIALRFYERLAPHPVLRAEQLERLAEDKAFDIDRARRDLGFQPRPFAEGVRAEAAMLL